MNREYIKTNLTIGSKASLAALLATIGLNTAQADFDVRLYFDIPRVDAEDIGPVIADGDFPDNPDIVDRHNAAPDFFTDENTSFNGTSGFVEWPQNGLDGAGTVGGDSGFNDYGGAISGLLYVPVSGSYRFHVRSDDESALYFNPAGTEFLDPSADGVEPVAIERDCCDGFEQDPSAETVSEAFDLVAGQAYAFEVIWSEGGGGDWVQVGWSRDGGAPEVIPAYYLQRDLRYGDDSADGITSFDDEVFAFVEEGDPFCCIGVSFEKDGSAESIQWQYSDNFGDDWNDLSDIEGQLIGSNSPAINILSASGEWNEWLFRAVVDGEEGPETELEVQLDEDAPFVTRAGARGNPNGVTVFFSEPVSAESALEASNYSVDGGSRAIEEVVWYQTVDGEVSDSAVVLRLGGDAFEFESEHTVSVENIVDRAFIENEMSGSFEGDFDFGGSLAISAEPTHAWLFDEGGGSTANPLFGDRAGELLHTAEFDADSPFPGASGSVVFDGTENAGSQGVHMGDLTFNGSSDWSMAIWIRSDDTGQDRGFWEALDSGGADAWGIRYDSTGASAGGSELMKLGFSFSSSNGDVNRGADQQETQENIQTTEWQHVVMVWESGEGFELYIDGALDEPTLGMSTDEGTLEEMEYFRLGDGSKAPWLGKVGETAVWDGTALTPEDVAVLQENSVGAGGAIGPVFIVDGGQPVDQTVDEHDSVTFNVEVDGAGPHRFQWMIDGQPVSGASGDSFTIEDVNPESDGAQVSVSVNNEFSESASDPATLTVIPDTIPPQLVSVKAIAGGVNTVVLTFDEELDADSALNPDNYSIDGLTIEGVSSSDDRTVVLETSDQSEGEEIMIQVNNVQDTSAAGNVYSDTIAAVSVLSYSDEVLADGPDHYWRLGDSGEEAQDVVNGNNGSYQNGVLTGQLPLVPNTRDDAAAGFDASQNQLIAVPNSGFINATNGPWPEKTIEFWFQPHSFPAPGTTGLAATQGMWEQGGGARAIEVYTFRPEDNDNPDEAELVFHIFNDPGDGPGSPFGLNGSDATFVATPISVNEVYHVVAVMDGDTEGTDGELRLYVNGELQGTAEDVGQIYNHTGDVQIGRGNALIHTGDNGNLGFFDGVLDEIAVYNIALSEERIQAHYSTGITPLVLPEVLTAISPASGAAVDTGEVTVTMIDGLGKTVDPESVSARAGGVEVDVSAVKDGDTTVVTYTPSGFLPAGATIPVEVSVTYTEGGSETFSLSFTTEDIPVLNANWAVGLDEGTERGFNVRSVQWDAGRANNTAAAEEQLANLDDDRIIVDTTGEGLVFDLINFNQDFDDGGGNGVFRGGSPTDEYQIEDTNLAEAGLIADDNTDNFSIEATTFLAFAEAGVYTMGVNSDDGFRVTSGISNALEDSALEVGVFSGGRGAANDSFQSTFRLMVPEAGIYAFRFITYEGGGGASSEWYSIDDGVPTLINDDGGIMAYVGRTRDPEPVDDAAITSISADAGNVTIEYTGTLQSAPSVAGPYSDVDGAASPYTFSPDGNVFLRVQ